MPVSRKPAIDPDVPDPILAAEREKLAIALAWAKTPERFPALTARVVERMRRALKENAAGDEPESAGVAADPADPK